MSVKNGDQPINKTEEWSVRHADWKKDADSNEQEDRLASG
jgi:hypothetical protein